MKKITGVLLMVVMIMMTATPADAGRYGGRHHGGGGRVGLGEALIGIFLIKEGVGLARHIIDVTNRPDVVYVVEPRRMLSCSSAYDCAYQRRILQKEREAERNAARLDRERERLEEEKGRNDADRDYRDYRY